MQPGEVKVYDPDQVVVIFGGVRLQGFAEGSMIEIKYDEKAFKKKRGTDGQIVRSKVVGRPATITVRLMQTSESNVDLDAMHRADYDAPGGTGITDFQIEDLQGNTLLHAEQSWIENPPDPAFADEAGPREWGLGCGHLVGTHGGN